MKLTTNLYGGLGSWPDVGGTIHAGYTPSPAGASNPPFTSLFRANGVTVDRVQGRGSSTMIGGGGAMASESWKLGRWQVESEADESKIDKERGRGEGKRQSQRMLSGKVRDSPFPFPRFIDLGEPHSRKLRALHTLTAGNAIRR
jgi:hypothetical protein